jgi:hypothetical protein
MFASAQELKTFRGDTFSSAFVSFTKLSGHRIDLFRLAWSA